MQPSLDWSSDVNLPVSGRTPAARHAGSSGAQRAAKDRPMLAVAYLELLKSAGSQGLSDFEAAKALGRQVSSLNSTRNGLGDLVVPSGSFQVSEFNTRRCR